MSIGYIAYFITHKNKRAEGRGFVVKSRHIISCAAGLLIYFADCRSNVVIFEGLSDGGGEECLRRALSSGVLIVTI